MNGRHFLKTNSNSSSQISIFLIQKMHDYIKYVNCLFLFVRLFFFLVGLYAFIIPLKTNDMVPIGSYANFFGSGSPGSAPETFIGYTNLSITCLSVDIKRWWILKNVRWIKVLSPLTLSQDVFHSQADPSSAQDKNHTINFVHGLAYPNLLCSLGVI